MMTHRFDDRLKRLEAARARPRPGIAVGRSGETAEQLRLRFRDEHGDGFNPLLLVVDRRTRGNDDDSESEE